MKWFPMMLYRIEYLLFRGIVELVRICNKSQFKIELKELDVPYSDDSRADITRITKTIQAQFEEWIRQYPEQWMWSNRRWS